MKINWLVRFKNPLFIGQIVLSILAPILAYMGMNLSDLTSWAILGNVLLDAIKNPYVIFLIVVQLANTVPDPTTKGIGDTLRAMGYTKPYKD